MRRAMTLYAKQKVFFFYWYITSHNVIIKFFINKIIYYIN